MKRIFSVLLLELAVILGVSTSTHALDEHRTFYVTPTQVPFLHEARLVRLCAADDLPARPRVAVILHGGQGHPWTPFNDAACAEAIATGGVAVIPWASTADDRFWNVCTIGGEQCADPVARADSQTAPDARWVSFLGRWFGGAFDAAQVSCIGLSRGAMECLHAAGNFGGTFDLVVAINGRLVSETYLGYRAATVMANGLRDPLASGLLNWPEVLGGVRVVAAVNGCDDPLGALPDPVSQPGARVRAFEGCTHSTEWWTHDGGHGWDDVPFEVRERLLALIF